MGELLEARKIKWKCRRGMLELDILLERFYENQFQILTAEEKKYLTVSSMNQILCFTIGCLVTKFLPVLNFKV